MLSGRLQHVVLFSIICYVGLIGYIVWMQGFAKGLLDVADNLGRATGTVPHSFRQLQSTSEDPSGAAKLLVSLLQGVEMTEKQLQQVC